MKTVTEYARIEFTGRAYLIVDSANQCHFVTHSERKAKNFLNRLLKNAGQA